jgi:hypothetical protein
VVEGSEFEVRVTWEMQLKLWKEYVISCLDISMLYRGVIKLRIFFALRSADVLSRICLMVHITHCICKNKTAAQV